MTALLTRSSPLRAGGTASIRFALLNKPPHNFAASRRNIYLAYDSESQHKAGLGWSVLALSSAAHMVPGVR